MKKSYKILLGLFILLFIIRLILPYVVLVQANKKISEMKGYYGQIEDIDLSLYRGAYQVKNVYLNKIDSVSKKQTTFFKAKKIDISLEWGALLHGRLVGEFVVDSPDLIFTKDKVEFKDVKKDSSMFRKMLKKSMPLKVNRFEINNGSIHYIDNISKPNVDVSLKNAHILALNLTNATNENIELPSAISAEASVYEGTLNFQMNMNALAENATFDLNAELKNTNLVLLNDFFKAYGNFTVDKGVLALYTEMAAKNGKFKGYLKPIIKDLSVIGPLDKNESFFQKLWESIVGTVGTIFKNQKEDQLATKIPIEGNFKNPKTKTFYAVLEVLENAFIQALVPSIDNEINIHSVKSK